MRVTQTLQIENCKLKIENCRRSVGSNGRQFALCNLHFAICNFRASRRGLSLTEVLIAMGILTLGLLGVASVFPVGSYYMQKAEISDKASAIAQSVMSDIMARGMLNPESWFVIVPTGPGTVWNATFSSDGAASPNGKVPGTFTRPFARALGDALNQSNAVTDKTVLSRQFGSAYVLDPLGISVMAARNGAIQPPTTQPGPAAVFPAAAYNGFGYHAAFPAWSTSTWAAWCGGTGSNYSGYEWPIRRVTFRQPSSGWHLDPQMAEHYFRGSDDLSYDFPSRDDRPAIQMWDKTGTSGNETPLARKWAGDYSWIVTVSPPTNDARNNIATNPEGFTYDVSVVVFYKRALPESADTAYTTYQANGGVYLSVMSQNERAVKANVLSTGLNGGELLLTDYGDYRDPSNPTVPKFNAFEHLRAGNWIMLCGPHANNNVVMSGGNYVSGEPRFVMNWYQVISVDAEGKGVVDPVTQNPFDSTKQRVVTLRGPEWPWQRSPSNTAAANDLCVAICKGAVAVHTKSLRLEGRSAGAAGFGSAGNTTTTPPPFGTH
jgi:hypothetical protein